MKRPGIGELNRILLYSSTLRKKYHTSGLYRSYWRIRATDVPCFVSCHSCCRSLTHVIQRHECLGSASCLTHLSVSPLRVP